MERAAAVARSLSNLANVVKAQKEYAAARSLYEESLAIFRSLGDSTGVAWSLDHQGDVAREQGDAAAARRRSTRGALRRFGNCDNPRGIAGSLADLGKLACDGGDFAQAQSLYTESLRIFQAEDHKRGIARLLECFACAAAGQRQPERTLRLAGTAAALRQAVGVPLSAGEQARLDRSLAAARQESTDAASAAAWMEGWATTPEKAIADALA